MIDSLSNSQMYLPKINTRLEQQNKVSSYLFPQPNLTETNLTSTKSSQVKKIILEKIPLPNNNAVNTLSWTVILSYSRQIQKESVEIVSILSGVTFLAKKVETENTFYETEALLDERAAALEKYNKATKILGILNYSMLGVAFIAVVSGIASGSLLIPLVVLLPIAQTYILKMVNKEIDNKNLKIAINVVSTIMVLSAFSVASSFAASSMLKKKASKMVYDKIANQMLFATDVLSIFKGVEKIRISILRTDYKKATQEVYILKRLSSSILDYLKISEESTTRLIDTSARVYKETTNIKEKYLRA